MSGATAGVRWEVTGPVGRLVLDRPRALHALTTAMVEALAAGLAAAAERELAAVVLTSSGGPAFCAGGDVRALREAVVAGDAAAARAFFTAEYALDAAVARSPVPVVSLVDGLCLGGGMGLAVHSAHRVLTERAAMAMPEAVIGFYPDVGATHFLSRLPGGTGRYLALTGRRVAAPDALALGLATHLVPSARLGEVPGALVAALEADPGRPVGDVLDALAEPVPAAVAAVADGDLAAHRADVDACFTAPSLQEARERLRERAGAGSAWARGVLADLDAASPQSLQVAWALQVWGAGRSLEECFAAETAMSAQLGASGDFVEGVRAALVDRDRRPAWGPSRFRGLDAAGRASWA